MAPKAKQTQEPKAQAAQPKAEAKAKAKAEPKAKADPKAKAEPKAVAKAVPEPAPKAEAKAKAKGEAKAKAKGKAEAPPPAAAPVAPKAEAKAAGKKGAKSAPAAPAPAKAVPEPPAAAAGSKKKAKGKAKPEPEPTPPPPPEPEPVEEAKKKKTNHRGGRNKNKEVDNFEDEEPVTVLLPKASGKAAQLAATASAKKDEKANELWARFADKDGKGESRPATRKAELEQLVKDVDQEMSARKAPRSKSSKIQVTSTQLEQNISELKQMTDLSESDRSGMMEAVKKELEEARAQEIYEAVKTRLNELKAKAEETVDELKARIGGPAAPSAGKGKGKDRESAPAREARTDEDRSEAREAAMLRRLGNLHKKDAAGLKVVTKTLELDLGITKYLFTPPHSFNGRFEQQFKVLVETVRPAKGGGKGGKGAAPEKGLTISGLSADEVSACEKALNALDFSGTKNREMENGLVMPSNQVKAELEKEFNVFVFKNQTQITVFGKNGDVNNCLAKIEDSGYSKAITVTADLVKIIYSQKLLDTWRAAGANISIKQPPQTDKGSQPAKITVQGKSKADTEETLAKVEQFVANFGTESVKADAGVVSKLFERSNAGFLAKKFREIQDANTEVSIRKGTDGLTLMGPKSKLKKAKTDLSELLAKANYEPVKVTMEPDQMRVFSKDHLDKIREKCSLVEIYKSSDKDADGKGRIDVIVLLGDAPAIAKAQTDIQEVLTKEGAVETVELSETAAKELLVNKGAKVQEIQSKHSTTIQVLKKGNAAKIFGSVEAVEATKTALLAFAKKADSVASKTMTLEADQIGRVIGSKGSTLNAIRKDCNVQITIDNNSPILQMRGEQKDLDKAEKMINDVLSGAAAERAPADARPKREPREPKAASDKAPADTEKKATSAAKPKAKPKGYAGDAAMDFPTLGGGDAKKTTKPAAKAWGKGADETAPAKEESPAEAYPELKAKAAAPAKEAPAAEEETEDVDVDDPFAMMGGMGEEIVYECNLVKEASEEEVAAAKAAQEQ